MEEKAYIVANNEQELDVLKKLEKDGFNWPSGLNPTNFFQAIVTRFQSSYLNAIV